MLHSRNIILLGLTLLITFILTGCPTTTGHDRREAEVGSYIQSLQVPLERWAMDNDDQYPEDINDLITSGILDEFPINALSDGNMEPIEFGAEPFEGNFTYVPVTVEDRIMGYYLFGYGLESTEGTDVDGDGDGDHVVSLVNGWIGEESDLTPLEELL